MPEIKTMKMLTTIKSFLERCALEKMNGELVLRLVYQQGGIRNMEVQRIETIKNGALKEIT
jgi:hypothetical protein